MDTPQTHHDDELDVAIPLDGSELRGDLAIPAGATAIVVFAHGSGSSRFSPRNRAVAAELRRGGLATLLVDLLTPEEERQDEATAEFRFDIRLLATRLTTVTDWLRMWSRTQQLTVGYFGASTGAAAALVAAAQLPETVRAVVSRGGRPDLAGAHLPLVKAPTLLIVGGADVGVLDLNREAMTRLGGPARLEIVPGATHLFEEVGALAQVARMARDWFTDNLAPVGSAHSPLHA